MYIIGDLHANIAELEKMLLLLNLNEQSRLVFLGDYIDKKIQTAETLKLLNDLKNKYTCTFIKGNHEFIWEKYLEGDLSRQEFILNHGSVEALRQYTNQAEELILNNQIDEIRKFLQPYLDFCKNTVDFYLADQFLAVHAGIAKEQLQQNPLVFTEANYFLRKDQMALVSKYLDKYTVVAGHTYHNQEPLIEPGYIGIDLGAGYDGFIGALDTDKKQVIRSDGKFFNLNI